MAHGEGLLMAAILMALLAGADALDARALDPLVARTSSGAAEAIEERKKTPARTARGKPMTSRRRLAGGLERNRTDEQADR